MTWKPTVGDFLRAIDTAAPYDQTERWDNCGLQLGSPEQEVRGCVIALDVTDRVIELAAESGANLIVTHHPVIFHPLRAVRGDDRICRMISRKIASISAHTNLDRAEGGVNDALFEALGLAGAEPFPNEEHLGKLGLLPREMASGELAAYLQGKLQAPHVQYIGEKMIRRVAVLSGAGGDAIAAAKDASADALITGEAKHSDFIDALNLGVPLFAAGHHDTEKVILAPLRSRLETCFPNVPFLVSDSFPVRHVLGETFGRDDI